MKPPGPGRRRGPPVPLRVAAAIAFGTILVSALVAPPAAGQEDRERAGEGEELPALRTTYVTATRSPHTSLETPYSTEAVGAERILCRAFRTMPQALQDLPGVLVQETALGQGSPYIRGFTGLRTTFLIDGIRLNNSVFREGPNQYWNTVDPLSVERLEIVKGPSSVLYGSDSIGGTVNAITRNPDTYGPGFRHGERILYRGATAERSHTGRIEVSTTSGDAFGLLAGGGLRDYGDVRGGPDVRTQPNTGYEEGDADVKVERFLDADTRLVLAYQRVRQNDVPRTHKTIYADPWEGTIAGTDLKRDLDQERDLAYVQLHGRSGGGWFDDYHVSLSWHRQAEEQNRIKGSGSHERQGFDVGTLGAVLQLGSPSPVGLLTWGLDLYHDSVDSFLDGNPIQGPVADDATYDLFGLYLQDEIAATERLTLTLGARLQLAAVDADRVQDPVTGEPISIDEAWGAAVGSARFLYRLHEDVRHLFGGVSQGFRAPNLSDLSRFDSARSNEFEIPAPGLDPERATSWELGIKEERAAVSGQAAVFYTALADQIVKYPTGNTNDEGDFEVTKDNLGDGYVWGIEVGSEWRFATRWSLFGNATYLEGKVDTYPTADPVEEREYIDRLMPPTARLGVRWEEDGVWWEALAAWAGDADRLSPGDEADTERIPPGGTPGYAVFHAHGGWRVNEHVDVRLGLENLTDEDYRIHGSGLNMPGRSVVVGLILTR
ncbi:MAG: TonB-dependent receptor [Planctomycetota bacterium]